MYFMPLKSTAMHFKMPKIAFRMMVAAVMLSLAVAACNNKKDEKKEGETKDTTVAPAPAPAAPDSTPPATIDTTAKGDAKEKPVKNPD